MSSYVDRDVGQDESTKTIQFQKQMLFGWIPSDGCVSNVYFRFRFLRSGNLMSS